MVENTGFDYVVKPLEEFSRGSLRLIKRCTKPDKKGEQQQAVQSCKVLPARAARFVTACEYSSQLHEGQAQSDPRDLTLTGHVQSL